MIITLNIDGIDREFEQTEDGRLTTVAPKTGWERGELMERYYTLDGASQPETYHPEDGERYDRADYFNSPVLAADIARATELYRKLLRWQAEHDKPVGIHDVSYHIAYYPKGFAKRESPPFVGIDCFETREVAATFDVLFSNGDIAFECIDEFRDELTWYFEKFRPRLDALGVKN